MTEEQGAKGTEKARGSSEFLDELQALGEQLSAAVKALWESEDSRKLRQDIGKGFVDLGQQLDEAVKSAQESESAKQFARQVKDTMDRARQTDVAGKVEEGLVTGLRELNDQLSKLVASLEQREGPTKGSGDEPKA
jgi:soluble cytochrome b562